jgi:hypothetical protein
MGAYWPTCRLTREESQYISKYFDPRFGRRGVLRRAYPGSLSLTIQQRTPQFNFQIGRRSKVFAFSCSGDIAQFQIQLITATGEKHTADFVDVGLLVDGWSEVAQQGLFPPVVAGTNTSHPGSVPICTQAYVMDPAITLEPNQTLTINGIQTQDYAVFGSDFRIDFVLHVWEYPGMPGSPL